MEKQSNNINIKEKIELYILGELEGIDEKEILDSVNEDKELQDYYNQIRTIVKSEEYSRIDKKFNEDNSLARVRKRILLSKEENITNYKLLFRLAASLLIASIISAALYFYISGKSSVQSSPLSYIEAPLGSKTKVVLPDGSEVILNAGSTIKYESNFHQTEIRKVELSGEAFFDVVKNENVPFVVNAKDVNIEALGTAFNVKAYKEEKAVIATLVEGLIQISKEGQEENAFLLKPKQRASIYPDSDDANIENVITTNQEVEKPLVKVNSITDKDVFVQKDINTDLSTSWKDDKWIIQKMSFGDLAILLERRYNVKFEFDSSEIKEFEFSGSFTNQTLELVLKALQLTAPIEFEIDNDLVNIKIDKKINRDYRRFLKKE